MIEPVAKNPYNVTMPVDDPKMFFGREWELAEIIEERIKHSHPISTILIGGRKIGKTSLLYQVRDRLLGEPGCDDGILVPAYISLQALSHLDIPTLFEHISYTIARCLQQHWGLLIEFPEEMIGDHYLSFLKRMWVILNHCGEHIGAVRFVLLIDEADRLLGQSWTDDVISNFRDLINTSDLRSFVAIVITGFRELHDYAMVEKDGIGSALGNAAYWTNLSVLTEGDTRILITTPLDGPIREEIIQAVHKQSGGHPFITQYLMQQVWKPNPGDVIPDDVVEASAQFFDQIKVFVSWQAKFADLDRYVYHVLASVDKPLTSNEVQAYLKNGAKLGEIRDSLDFLCYTGVVSKQGEKYAIAGLLFKNWFLQRHTKEEKKVSGSRQEQGFDIPRMLVGTFVVVVLFVVTIVALVWASQQVHPLALVFIIMVAVLFNLVSVITVLVMNGILRQKWAMDFYNNVLGGIFPLLRSGIERQLEDDRDVMAKDDQGT